jgi:hypothetical protein
LGGPSGVSRGPANHALSAERKNPRPLKSAVIHKGIYKLSLWPNKNQWKSWSLPSKLTAVGALLGFLSFSFYFLEKTFNILDWALQDDLKQVVEPEVSVDLQFPYERVDESVKQNKRNPELTITNRGSIIVSPLKVDVTVFVLTPSLDEITSAAILNYRTHGHLIFEPEIKPGSSVTASLPGIKNWAQPVAYRIRMEMFVPNNRKLPDLSLLYLIDENGIKGEGSKLSKSKAKKIKMAILDFEKSNDVKKKLTLYAPLEGVWVPHVEPGVNLRLNEDGTLTVK